MEDADGAKTEIDLQDYLRGIAEKKLERVNPSLTTVAVTGC